MSPSLTRREMFTAIGAAGVAPYLRPAVRAAEGKPLSGAFMILSTPYTASNEVHHEDLAGQVDFLDRCGVHGFVWPQNSSEQRYLSKDERLRGMDTIAKAAHGKRQALIFGVQADDTEGRLEYARYAESLDPDSFSATDIAEIEYRLDGLREYLRA